MTDKPLLERVEYLENMVESLLVELYCEGGGVDEN